MAYMVYQRVATAIHEVYGAPDEPAGPGQAAPTASLEAQLELARQARTWLESLAIDPTLRASLVEPIAVIEAAFRDLVKAGRGTSPRPRRHDPA
jgi:hypothetical protein